MSLFDRLRVDRSIAEDLSFNPYYIAASFHRGGALTVDGKKFVDLASNDYLGLSSDERVVNGALRAMKNFGASLCATPIATGSCSIFTGLKNRLARFAGVEDGMLFPSGFQANTSLFTSIASKDDLVIIDHYAHASLIQGVKSAQCKVKPFMHNRCDHLEKLLKNATGHRDVFVVTESVFSTEGAIAPFN